MTELGRWVDPRVEKVRLADLRTYLLAHGWKLKPFPQPHVLVFEEPVEGGEEPVVQVLPVSEQARDFRRSVIDAPQVPRGQKSLYEGGVRRSIRPVRRRNCA